MTFLFGASAQIDSSDANEQIVMAIAGILHTMLAKCCRWGRYVALL